MKIIFSLIVGGSLVVSGFGQTRNVLVGTNNAVVQPTNFWSADASNARTGLGLGTAATNPESSFQASSLVLSNLASSNAINLTNINATNIVGIVSLAQGGTGSTNASDARTALGLGTAATNPASAFQSSSATLSNLATSNGGSLTNLQSASLVGVISASNIPSFTFTNLSGTLSITQGGTGATNSSNARQNLGSTVVGDAVFIATNATEARAAIGALASNGNGAGLTNITAGNITGSVAIANGGTGATNAATARTNLGLGWSALTNTNSTNFRNAIGLGETNNVTFNSAQIGSDILISNTTIYWGGAPKYEIETGVFFHAISFDNTTNATESRANLGLPWSGLTNTDSATFQAALFGTNTNPVLVNTNGSVVSPTNFWAVAPISTTVQYQTNVTGTSTNAATNSRNLFLFSLSPSVSGVTNTVTLPTNPATTFEGDRATITHLAQTTNAVTAIRQLGAATNIITLNQLDEAVLLMYRSGAWMLADNISYVEPIFFSGTNAAANMAASRTNLGLGTTNSVSFQNISLDAGQLNFSNGAIYWLGDVRYEPETQTFQGTVQIDNGSISLVGSNAASNIATTRTNLGLGLPALTNNNVTNFRTAIGLGETDNVAIGSDGGSLSTDDFNAGNVNVSAAVTFTTNTAAATTRTNLGLGAAWLTNANVTNFRTAVGLGTNDVVAFGDTTVFSLIVQDVTPISIAGDGLSFNDTNSTNIANGKAGWRDSLGLGATNNVSFSNVTASGTLTSTGAITATTNIVVNGFVDFSTNHTNSNPATNNQIQKFLEVRIGTNQFWLPLYK
jgi:hypothetical protein